MRTKDEEKRAAISEAAISLIQTQGFADVSMSKIAKAAGVSPSTIYVYFENKEVMLNKLYLYAKGRFFDALTVNINYAEPIKVIFRKVFENYRSFIANNSVLFEFSEQFANSPLVNRLSAEEMARFDEQLFGTIHRGVDENILVDADVMIIATMFFSPLLMYMKTCARQSSPVTPEKTLEIFELSWKAISK